jgi:hypothetical protein
MRNMPGPSLQTLRNWLLLVPFLLSTLFAPGIMPHQAADGSFTVVLCFGDGPLTLRIDQATGAPVPDDDSAQDLRCDWQMAHDSLAEAQVQQVLPQRFAVSSDLALPVPSPSRAALRFQRPVTRAPPLLI